MGERKHDLVFVKVVHEAHGLTTEPPQDFCDHTILYPKRIAIVHHSPSLSYVGNSTAYISIALGAHSAEKQGSHQRTFTNKHSAWRAFSRKIRQPSEDVYESAAAARRALDDD
jgi:hypothetical protein